ncbi:MAG: regulatory protein RecX [Eubacterium sp.]
MIISHSKGRGKKIHILIDDEYQITTDVDFLAENYIKDGTDITEEQWNELVTAINYKKAVNKCYDLLSRRDHSVKELRDKLLRTVDEASADKAIDKMLELGYLDDERYAGILLNHLVNEKRMSKSFIKQEMYKRGLSADIIAYTLEDGEIDNSSNCAELILTKYKNKLNIKGGKEKITASLMRKGFSYYDIKSAFDMIENEEYV